jgi:hypothetical protein
MTRLAPATTWIGALLGAALAAQAGAAELSTPPIASKFANTFLTCAIQNASAKSTTARVQIVEIPSGSIVTDSGDQVVASLAGLSAAAVSAIGCSNGDCPCPNSSGVSCAPFSGTAYCRFVVKGSKTKYRAAGCVSSISANPQSSPTCVDAR